jgi:hypothetical protein
MNTMTNQIWKEEDQDDHLRTLDLTQAREVQGVDHQDRLSLSTHPFAHDHDHDHPPALIIPLTPGGIAQDLQMVVFPPE